MRNRLLSGVLGLGWCPTGPLKRRIRKQTVATGEGESGGERERTAVDFSPATARDPAASAGMWRSSQVFLHILVALYCILVRVRIYERNLAYLSITIYPQFV